MGVVISGNPTLNNGENLPPFPLNHARIGFESYATRTNVIASSEAAGFPAAAATNSLTYESWRPGALPATWSLDAGEAVDVNYVGIAAHTFATDRCSIDVQYSVDDSIWITLGELSPGNGDAIMILSETIITARYWRVVVSGTSIPTVGVIYVGEALAMQRPFYGGHGPITLNRTSKTIGNKSEGGQILGVTKIRQGNATSYQWQHLTAAWYRSTFDKFAKVASTRGFFIAWNPLLYPNEVGYGITNGEMTPTNMGIRDLMEVGFSMDGHSNE